MSTEIRERVSKIEIRRPHLSATRLNFSVFEIGAALIVLLFFVATIYYYFSSLKPEQDRFARLEAQYNLQKQQISISKPDTGAPSRDTLKDALESLASFKTQYLKPRHQGQRALIDEINGLVKKQGVQLTSGLEMSLENTGQSTEKKRTKTRSGEPLLNPFPQLNMNFTISGPYEKIRAFVSDLEKNKQFLMIRAITFIAAAEEADGETGRRRRSRSNASGISVTVNLAAYFQP